MREVAAWFLPGYRASASRRTGAGPFCEDFPVDGACQVGTAMPITWQCPVTTEIDTPSRCAHPHRRALRYCSRSPARSRGPNCRQPAPPGSRLGCLVVTSAARFEISIVLPLDGVRARTRRSLRSRARRSMACRLGEFGDTVSNPQQMRDGCAISPFPRLDSDRPPLPALTICTSPSCPLCEDAGERAEQRSYARPPRRRRDGRCRGLTAASACGQGIGPSTESIEEHPLFVDQYRWRCAADVKTSRSFALRASRTGIGHDRAAPSASKGLAAVLCQRILPVERQRRAFPSAKSSQSARTSHPASGARRAP